MFCAIYSCRGLEQLIGSHPDEVKSQRDEDGNGALHLAAANNHLDLVCLLAEKVYYI